MQGTKVQQKSAQTSIKTFSKMYRDVGMVMPKGLYKISCLHAAIQYNLVRVIFGTAIPTSLYIF